MDKCNCVYLYKPVERTAQDTKISLLKKKETYETRKFITSSYKTQNCFEMILSPTID